MQENIQTQFRDLRQCCSILDEVLRQARQMDQGIADLMTIVSREVGSRDIFAQLTLFSHSGAPLVCETTPRGATAGASGADVPLAGLSHIVQQSHAPVVFNDLRRTTPPDYLAHLPTLQERIRSEMALPILVGGKLVGVVDVASTRANVFGDQDVQWLQQVVMMLQFVLQGFEPKEAVPPIVRELVSGEDVDRVVDDVLRTALQATGLQDAYSAVLVVDGDRVISKRACRIEHGVLRSDSVEGAEEWSKVRGITGRALRTGQRTYAPNVREDPDYFPGPTNIQSELVIPIKRGPDHLVAGALDIQAPILNAFTHDAISSLEALAEEVNLALFTAQLSEMVKREQTVLERLAGVAPSVVRRFDPHHVYDLILEAAFSLLTKADACQILLVTTDPKTRQQYLVVEHALLAPTDRSENRLPRNGRCQPPLHRHRIEEGVTGLAARTQETKYVADVGKLPGARFIPFVEGIQSELAIPLALADTIIGVLNIESQELDAFSRREQLIAELLATEAGLAISNAQDYARTIRLLNTVADATREVVGSVEDTDHLIDAILRGAMQVTNTEDGYCALILLDEDGMLHIEKERSDDLLSGREMVWPKDRGLTGRAVQHKRPVYVRDVHEDPAYIAATPSTRSNLVVPLLDSYGEAVGALSLESPRVSAFDDQAQKALEQFGPPVVAALIKNRLVRSLEQQQRETIDLMKQVTHMLRSPVQTLQDGLQEVAGVESHAPTLRQAQPATAFLKIVLDWLDAQAEVLGAEHGRRHWEEVDVVALVSTITDAYRYYAERKHIRLEVESPAQAAIHAHLVRGEMVGALVELLANAVKYSDKHGRVQVQVVSLLQTVQIVVEDEGSGVPPGERERVFMRNVRGSNIGEARGSGLGLYFVRQAMERQGGDAFVEPRLTPDGRQLKGSRFVLQFPADTSHHHAE